MDAKCEGGELITGSRASAGNIIDGREPHAALIVDRILWQFLGNTCIFGCVCHTVKSLFSFIQL